MNSLSLVSLVFLVWFMLCPAISTASVGVEDRSPNVVFVITDDQGYGDISSHGNSWIKTPQMDKLASQSIRLDDYHTSPYCVPARLSIPGKSYTDESIYMQEFIHSEWRSVVKRDYKFIVTVEKVGSTPEYTSLFNLKQDPYELNNLLNNPEFKEIQDDMIGEYNKWRKDLKDPFPEYPEQASYSPEGDNKTTEEKDT